MKKQAYEIPQQTDKHCSASRFTSLTVFPPLSHRCHSTCARQEKILAVRHKFRVFQRQLRCSPVRHVGVLLLCPKDVSSLALIPLVKEHVDERQSVGGKTRIGGGGTHWEKYKYLKVSEKAGAVNTWICKTDLQVWVEPFVPSPIYFTVCANMLAQTYTYCANMLAQT